MKLLAETLQKNEVIITSLCLSSSLISGVLHNLQNLPHSPETENYRLPQSLQESVSVELYPTITQSSSSSSPPHLLTSSIRYLLQRTHLIPLVSFESSLKFSGDHDTDIDEVQCIIANLIDKVSC